MIVVLNEHYGFICVTFELHLNFAKEPHTTTQSERFNPLIMENIRVSQALL